MCASVKDVASILYVSTPSIAGMVVTSRTAAMTLKPLAAYCRTNSNPILNESVNAREVLGSGTL